MQRSNHTMITHKWEALCGGCKGDWETTGPVQWHGFITYFHPRLPPDLRGEILMTWTKVLNVWGFIVVFTLGNPFKDQEAVPTVTFEELKTHTKSTAFYLSRRPSFRWRSPIRVKSWQATRPLTSNIRLRKWWQTTFKDKNGLKLWQQ